MTVRARFFLLLVLFPVPIWSQVSGAALPPLHLIGQVQSGIENGGSSVKQYRIVKGELQMERVLLELKGDPMLENIAAMDKLGDFFFISYPYGGPLTVEVYDWVKDKIFDPVAISLGAEVTVDNTRGYSQSGNNAICATWPISVKDAIYNFKAREWSGGESDLRSVCATSGKAPAVLFDQWDQSRNPLWPGTVGNNFDAYFILHRAGDTAIPAAAGAPPVPIATLPKEFAAKDIRKVPEVSAASNQYLILSASPTPYRLISYVLNRMTNQWKFLDDTVGVSYRIFGSMLVASAESCVQPENDPQMRQTCIRTVRDIRDLDTNKVYPLPGARDSEVVDIEPDRTVLFREGTTLYQTKIGATLNRSKDAIAEGDTVENIHWAFYR